MKSTLIRNKEAQEIPNALQVTALLYLQEALAEERYEECTELVSSAKELGVEQIEISTVLASYIRQLKGNGSEANQNNARRRF